MQIRLMQASDLAAVYALQASVYRGAMVEALELLQQRLQLAPATAWVACDGSAVHGYLMGYASVCGNIARLATPFCPAEQPDALYLHDLAVAPAQAGRGVGRALAQHGVAYAQEHGLAHVCLVSVQGTTRFWEGLGFQRRLQLSPEQQSCLDSYAGPAWYYQQQSLGP